MDTGLSCSLVLMKIVENSNFTVFEDTKNSSLTDKSGCEMRVLGVAQLTIATLRNPETKANIIAVVTDSIKSDEVLIGPVDQKQIVP